MLVIKKTTCPYIASRNLESTDFEIVFEGKAAECKQYLLSLYNDGDFPYAETIRQAEKNSKGYDGLSNNGKRFDYDSRVWLVVTKKEYKEWKQV